MSGSVYNWSLKDNIIAVILEFTLITHGAETKTRSLGTHEYDYVYVNRDWRNFVNMTQEEI